MKHAAFVCCAIALQRQDFLKIAEQARLTAHTPEAEVKRGATQRRRFEAQRKWDKSTQPKWLTEEFYLKQIQPRLGSVEVKEIAATLGVSVPHASNIREGRRLPHPRHWKTLAKLSGASEAEMDKQGGS